jgi:hypothetical protein
LLSSFGLIMAKYNTAGEEEFTEVVGDTYTGRNNADGSTNIVLNDGSTYTGYHHACGAINAVITTSNAQALHANGSQYVILQADTVGYTPVG